MKTSSHDTPSQDVEYHCIFFPAKKLQLHPLLVIENLSRLCFSKKPKQQREGRKAPAQVLEGSSAAWSCL